LTTAVVESLDNDLLRVSLHLPRPWIVSPGQHIYLYIPYLSLWTSHPFSVCWNDDVDTFTTDTDENDESKITPTKTIYIYGDLFEDK
jgi:hypothetical protein